MHHYEPKTCKCTSCLKEANCFVYNVVPGEPKIALCPDCNGKFDMSILLKTFGGVTGKIPPWRKKMDDRRRAVVAAKTCNRCGKAGVLLGKNLTTYEMTLSDGIAKKTLHYTPTVTEGFMFTLWRSVQKCICEFDTDPFVFFRDHPGETIRAKVTWVRVLDEEGSDYVYTTYSGYLKIGPDIPSPLISPEKLAIPVNSESVFNRLSWVRVNDNTYETSDVSRPNSIWVEVPDTVDPMPDLQTVACETCWHDFRMQLSDSTTDAQYTDHVNTFLGLVS